MTDDQTASRLLPIPGLRNARDLAGSHAPGLRPGLLYRSGWLAELTPEGARQLAKLAIRTVIDLRDPVELDTRPDRTHDWDVDLANFPVLPQDGTDHAERSLAELYPLMADHSGATVVAVLRRLLAPQALPALVHCAVGRDRTGIVVALLLALLEVPDEVIVADFLLSNEGLGLLDGPREYTDAQGVVRLARPVEAALITGLLSRVRERHGSVETYLIDNGLNPEEVTSLRATLRE
ncbi:tyrosine-protein phosphatase [Kitasatospora nipponensis]|uniref:Tyrosine-protein phosphatase n=1 Tax=Kitasatospora nipponensis TaxID=258049 RepID=A0ABN1T7M0_9ACTN